MSLDKAIKYGKEKRKPYRGAKAVDKTCRNHGGCPYCEEGRLHKGKKIDEESKDRIEEVNKGVK
jgi:hypothetical protein